jgi:hypothetical protein
MRGCIAKDAIARAFSCQTPVHTGGSGSTGGSKRVWIWVDQGVNAIPGSSGRTR